MDPAFIDLQTLNTVVRPIAELFHESKAAATLLIGGTALATSATQWYIGRRSVKKGVFRKVLGFYDVIFTEPDGPNGPVLVQLKIRGNKYELGDVIVIPALEKTVASATRRSKDGILRLKHGPSHKFMMDTFAEHVDGNDLMASNARLKKRPTDHEGFALAPTFFCEEELSMIRGLVFDDNDVKVRLQDPNFVARLKPFTSGDDNEVDMVKEIAQCAVSDDMQNEHTACVKFFEMPRLPLAA